MPNTLFDRLRGRSPALWAMIAAFIALNIWYDYHHPLGLIVDGIVVVGLIVWLAGTRSG